MIRDENVYTGRFPFKMRLCVNDSFFSLFVECCALVQLFRERLSQKVHATITKGIVGGFEFAVLQRNLKEWHKRPWTYVCAC